MSYRRPFTYFSGRNRNHNSHLGRLGPQCLLLITSSTRPNRHLSLFPIGSGLRNSINHLWVFIPICHLYSQWDMPHKETLPLLEVCKVLIVVAGARPPPPPLPPYLWQMLIFSKRKILGALENCKIARPPTPFPPPPPPPPSLKIPGSAPAS